MLADELRELQLDLKKLQDRLSESDDLLRRVLSFHIDSLSFTTELDKKALGSYYKLMVEIHEYLNGKEEERKDIHGN